MKPLPAMVAERVARESYGRLLAYLAAKCRNFGLAEDALADAFAAALAIWPREGVPIKPEAWLITVAGRKSIDNIRHERVVEDAFERLLMTAAEAEEASLSESVFPDERLKLMFVCAHPAIDPSARTPLMLQTVLGLDAAQIAATYVVPPATMGQRLSRAKAKIRDAGIAFEIPSEGELAGRAQAVLDAVYAAYCIGGDLPKTEDCERSMLIEEAVWLARLVAALLPENPEALGLLSLILFCKSRLGASRHPVSGAFVPLSGQDPARWCDVSMDEANTLLKQAARFGEPGRYQIEAAIQAVHAGRRRVGFTDWGAIRVLYDGLIELAPSIGAHIARAAVLAETEGAGAGLAALNALDSSALERYQPYWSVYARLLEGASALNEAHDSYKRAIALTKDTAVKAYLIERMNALCR